MIAFLFTHLRRRTHILLGEQCLYWWEKKCPQNTGRVHIDWGKVLNSHPNHLHLPLSPVYVLNWGLKCHRGIKSRNVPLEVMAETWMSSLIASLMSRLICISPPTYKTGCNMFLHPKFLPWYCWGLCWCCPPLLSSTDRYGSLHPASTGKIEWFWQSSDHSSWHTCFSKASFFLSAMANLSNILAKVFFSFSWIRMLLLNIWYRSSCFTFCALIFCWQWVILFLAAWIELYYVSYQL